MLTIEEIRTEWKGLKGAVATVISYVDGQIQHLGEIESCWQKGYDCGHKDGLKQGMSQSEDCYQRGLEDAWEAAKRMTVMQPDECLACFGDGGGQGAAYYYLDGIFKLEPQEAIQKIKEHDAIIRQVTHSNAQKFVEIFGFAPGYEILDDGREVYPSLNDEWWNAEYKEPKGKVE